MSIEAAAHEVLKALRAAAIKSGRAPASITLVAVSKTKSIDEMRAYAKVARREGLQIVFGENYVQEIKEKRPQLPEGSELHMIGPLQSNKVRDAVTLCDVIESVHSLKVLGLVAKEAARLGKRQRILLQVNIGKDENKSGFSVEALNEALEACAAQSNTIQLEGLMTILPYDDDPEAGRPHFKAMAVLRAELVSRGKVNAFHNS